MSRRPLHAPIPDTNGCCVQPGAEKASPDEAAAGEILPPPPVVEVTAAEPVAAPDMEVPAGEPVAAPDTDPTATAELALKFGK